TEVEADAARQHAVARATEAARLRRPACAVQRRLHRRRWDSVRVDDPFLEREHDQDRPRDREDPVERDPDAAREPWEEPREWIAAALLGVPSPMGVVEERIPRDLGLAVAAVVSVVAPLPRRVGVGPVGARLLVARAVVRGPAGLRLP